MPFPIHDVTEHDESYPPLLRESAGHPSTLHYRGILPATTEQCIAIVGTRKATREGIAIAYSTAEALVQRGFTIVSGLALGIDGAAHDGALAGGGKTIAVLANGLDSIYPRIHENLAMRILEQDGCIISEYPDESPAYPNQFLERNRIVSGLSIATIVIEAPLRSGSLATARNAIEQGREVFVFPGNSLHSNFKGSHKLIRDGARLVTGYADILEDLGLSTLINPAKPRSRNEAISDPIARTIIKTLEDAEEPLTIDLLCELTTLEPHIVSEQLTILGFDGIIAETNKGFQLIP